MNAVLGTAGHIDHGKTTLVRALTGINCDRLDEERRRGITIELGFAWLDLSGGERLGIVDVPGHERFVKNMVAGAAGIDCVMLVIAADEGIMPQTREHLDICSILGIKRGLVALTKADTVVAEWLALVREDTRAGLRGTFLENSPIIPVSSTTGAGMDDLRAEIEKLVYSLNPRQGTDIFRLPVDRVFSLKGFGTVVTGTIVSGKCSQGENLCVAPSEKTARARSLQVHSVPVSEAYQGQRCAINFQGIEADEIHRGDVITRPDSLFPARRWLARLTCLASAPAPLRQRMEVHFHHQAGECGARILFFDRPELKQGETAVAELDFDQEMAGVYGDHFVIRANSPLRAIAGGMLLDPLPPLLRPRDPLFRQRFALLEKLASMENADVWKTPAHEPKALLKMVLALRELPGASERQLAVLTGLPAEALKEQLAQLEAAGEAFNWDGANGWWADKGAIDGMLAAFVRRAGQLHAREPLKSCFSPNALYPANDIAPRFLQKVLEEGVKRNILKLEGNGVRLSSWEINLTEKQAALLKQFQEIYLNAGFTPPLLKEIMEKLDVDAKLALPVLAHLCEKGEFVKIQEGLYYHSSHFEKIMERIRDWFNNHPELDVGDMKTMFDVSRKFAIPLLEYLDAIRFTYRVGNKRKLRG